MQISKHSQAHRHLKFQRVLLQYRQATDARLRRLRLLTHASSCTPLVCRHGCRNGSTAANNLKAVASQFQPSKLSDKRLSHAIHQHDPRVPHSGLAGPIRPDRHIIAQDRNVLAYNKVDCWDSIPFTQSHVVSSLTLHQDSPLTPHLQQHYPFSKLSLMTPHATEDTRSSTGDMSNHSAPLTNGETSRSKSLSVRTYSHKNCSTTSHSRFAQPYVSHHLSLHSSRYGGSNEHRGHRVGSQSKLGIGQSTLTSNATPSCQDARPATLSTQSTTLNPKLSLSTTRTSKISRLTHVPASAFLSRCARYFGISEEHPNRRYNA